MTEQRHINALNPLLNQGRTVAATGTVGRWLADIVKRWQRNQVIARMHKLDDRRLADIGITRGEITQAVDGILNDHRTAEDDRIDGAKLARPEEQPKLAA